MVIKKIVEIDKTSGEADIIVTDGVYELMCYYHPAENIKVGAKVCEITSLFAKEIMRIEGAHYLIKKELDNYSYCFHGQVINKLLPLIGVGGLRIKLDNPLPKDIDQGEFVEFKVDRLDCIVNK